jgi:glycosyltransferase involved in cell wall biosynthesis
VLLELTISFKEKNIKEMKKHLIFITEALWIGGIETALVNLLNRLDYDRYDVTCLILRDSREMAYRITPKCRLIVADRQHTVSFSEAYRHKRMYNLMEEPQHATKFRRLIWHILCLLLRAPEAALYASYVKKQMRGEHFATAVIYSDRAAETAVRAISAEKFLMFYHHGAMRREYHDTYGYRKSEKVIAVSEALAEKLCTYRPRYADKIIYVNNLIDIDTVRRKSLDLPSTVFPKDRFNIVSCGRLSPAKGMDIAVDACAKLVNDGVNDIHWWIVGGGPEEDALREQIRTLDMDSYVTLLGMQDNPYPYIRRADLYVQPSRFEAFGLSILEAQVLDVPILATKTDGAKELIEDGKTGALCNISVKSLAESINVLKESPQTRQAYRNVLSDYDFEQDNTVILQKLYTLF